MDWLDHLPFPVALGVSVLGFIVLPLAGSILGIRWVYRITRGWASGSAKRRLRALSIGFFAAPTVLIEAAPSVHGALVLPHLAWFGLVSSLIQWDRQGIALAVIPMVVVAFVAWMALGAIEPP